MNKSEQGKKNRLAGARFERKVRKDLEEKGWIISKWMNNIETVSDKRFYHGKPFERLHPARSNRFNMRSTGFPDFIAFKPQTFDVKMHKLDGEIEIQKSKVTTNGIQFYEVIAVEVKTNGKLSKVEKEKCEWYLDNNIFSKILIASKFLGGFSPIVYKEFSSKGRKE